MDIQTIVTTAALVIFGTAGVALFGIVFGLFYKGVDRKLSAHMQGRIGPPIRQPFRDVVKLFTKENIVPENAIPWVFHLAPLAGLVATISILLYLPLGGFEPLLATKGDLILILYLLIIPSLAMVIGGFAAGSPYATIGAQREMATMIAYEFPLAIIIISIAWRLSYYGAATPFALSTIASTPVWNIVGPLGFIGLLLLLLVLIIVTPAELSKIPFDSPEAETEIAGGLLVEYSGRNLAMFYLTDGVKTLVLASLIVALFFPYNLSPLLGLDSYPAFAVDIIFYLVKVLLIVLFSVTLIRVAVARLKIDQIVYAYWVPLTLIALVGLICIMWDSYTMQEFGLQPVLSMLGLA
ncbi:MAG: NADH-quinone oxidoreductase subunit H [Candidatus Thermoplasmatota archaeon]|nr:NADH-quinone oxidoreductase subunit H [Candidatus Thermoplasmatota archaeon]